MGFRRAFAAEEQTAQGRPAEYNGPQGRGYNNRRTFHLDGHACSHRPVAGHRCWQFILRNRVPAPYRWEIADGIARHRTPATRRCSSPAFKKPRLSKLEGGAADNLTVDADIDFIGADSQGAGTQIVYILTAISPEV